MNAEGVALAVRNRNQCSLGEISPGVDVRTVEEALEVAREMARALDLPRRARRRITSRPSERPCVFTRLGQSRGVPHGGYNSS